MGENDSETAAISAIVAALEELDDSERARVLRYVNDRYETRIAFAHTTSTSLQRSAILDVVISHGGESSPQRVTDTLNEQGNNTNPTAVQTNMSRMAKRGQLVLVRRGLYAIPNPS